MPVALTSLLALVGGDPVEFGRDVLPVLSELCFDCHGPDAAARKADLRLDLRDDVLFVAEPGAPDESELVARLVHDDPERRMPPARSGRTATPEQIETLRRWIEEGVEWESHWAFVPPVAAPAATTPANEAWCRDPLDAYVAERLARAGLEPSPAADPATWLRRVTLDLTGLPPTLDELDAFLAGRASEAEVVDRLLASRARAEHRTREWLDIARYADTNGYQNDFRRDQWPWRDWVLRAFESNMPYDRFVVEQVAGDLVPDATDATTLGTGFQRNHRTVTEAGSIDEEWRVENVADRAETTATAFLGLTLGCARCHDHKYDSLSQRDYYAFYAFFDQTDEKGVYQETRGNVAPLLRVPSRQQSLSLVSLAQEVEEVERRLDGLGESAPERHAAWRLENPSRATSTGAGVLTFGGANERIDLDGTDEGHVDLGRAVAFESDRPFTVSLWVRPDSRGAVYSRMADDDGYRGTDLVLMDDLRPAVHLIHTWTANAIKVVGAAPLAKGRWNHVAVTYDGTSKAAGVGIVVNGQPVDVTVEADSLDGTIATDEPLRLGLRRYAGALRGTLHDVRVDARVLAADEILGLAAVRAARDDGLPFFRECFDPPTIDLRRRVASMRAEIARIEREIPTAMVLRDRAEPRTTRVLDRGRYDHPVGDPIAPDVPEVFGGLPDGAPRNRLGLARWLVGPDQPLTARVAVNRVWASFFGRGLVDTPEDFGVRGDRPEHGALLDALARDLVASGWDLAALERRIALSATYRQSSDATPELRERDPHNELLARGPRHRLDAEAVRDQALAVSGLLAHRWGGPSVKPYQPEGLWTELAGGAGQGAYEPATGDDLFRRSLYTYRKRTVPHPLLTTFDAPGFELCTARRPRTNTPLQALAMLNGPTYVEAARHLAQRMLRASEDDDGRLGRGVRLVLAREPSAAEIEVLRGALAGHRERYTSDPSATRELLGVGATAPPEEARTAEWAAMTMVASTLLNLDEAVTPR
ncbi:MAG: DUF1553 domain-containing protein [Planctomycetota bacterium]